MITHLARASVEGAVLAAGVWLACRALPRTSPRVRTLLWWCVAAKFVVALAWTTPIAVPVLPRAAMQSPGAAADASALSRLAPPRTAGPAARGPARPARVPWTAFFGAAWALGVGIALLRTLQAWWRTRGVVTRSVPADPGLHAMAGALAERMRTRRVQVRASAEVESPVVVGVRRPVILVPAPGFAALPADQQRMALCHELAHLSRGDLWLGCVPAAAERCFFFHPLARLAAREYAFWREAACDEAVLATLGTSPQSYGRMLLALGVSRRTAAFSAAGAAWSFQNLKRRITMLDRTSPRSFRGRALAACAVAAAVLAVVPLKAVARSAAPPRAPSAAPAPRPAFELPPAPSAATAAPAAAAARAAASAAAIGTARAQELPFVLLRADGDDVISGNSGDVQRARRHRRAGEALLWFRYGGQEYVVRDAGVLRQAEALWVPVGEIGAAQGRIGEQQGAIGEAFGRVGEQLGEIGERQGQLGERMGALGARLGALAAREAADAPESERRAMERERDQLQGEMDRLEAQMEALDQQMRRFEVPMEGRDSEMEELGRQMEALGERMEAAVDRANAGMLALVRSAMENGTAQAVR